MESNSALVSAAFLVPLLIVAVTQMAKMALPQITGWVTIIIALVVGVIVALVDQEIGVTDITIAQGLVFAVEAVGVAALAGKAGGGASGDRTPDNTVNR